MADQLDPSLIMAAYHLKQAFDSSSDSHKAFHDIVSRIKYFRKMHRSHPKVYSKVV